MVKDQTDYDPVVYQQMLESTYWHQNTWYRKSERNKSDGKRFYNHFDADYTPKLNLFANRDPSQNYEPITGRFPTYHHDYSDHENR